MKTQKELIAEINAEEAARRDAAKRLTIEVVDWNEYHGEPISTYNPPWYWHASLDGSPITRWRPHATEPEARAAAQAYVDELIKHFKEGGT